MEIRFLKYFIYLFLLTFLAIPTSAEELRYDLGGNNQEIFDTITNEEKDSDLEESLGPSGLTILTALEYGLSNNPDILRSRLDLDIVEANEISAQGSFDTTLSASVDTSRNRSPFQESSAELLGFDSSDSISDSAIVSLSKMLTTGTTLTASADVSRFEDRRSNATPDSNTSTLRLSINQPLLRGFGDDIPDADIKLAALSTEAQRARLIFNIMSTARRIAQNFWSYADATELLAIYETSIQRLNKISEELDGLIAQGLYKGSDKDVIEARLGELESAKLSTEDFVRSSRDNLGLSIGVKDAERESIPAPQYTLYRAKEISQNTYEKYLQYAKENRRDLQSERIRIEQADLRVQQAENNLLPNLDFFGSVGKSRVSEGEGIENSITTLYEGNSASSWSAGLSFSFPLANNSARGQLRQEEAFKMSQELGIYDLERSVSFSVSESYEQLESLRKQITQNETTFANFLKLYREQLENFRQGNASLFDLRQTEQDLTNAEISLASNLVRYYQQLTSFRFETDTLITKVEDEDILFEEKRFLSPVFFEELDVDQNIKKESEPIEN